jgi:hypothetical protein
MSEDKAPAQGFLRPDQTLVPADEKEFVMKRLFTKGHSTPGLEADGEHSARPLSRPTLLKLGCVAAVLALAFRQWRLRSSA